MTLFTDNVQSGIEHALTAVSLRQRVTASNISNAMTPGYRAQRVDFEASLTAAMATGDPSAATTTMRRTTDAPKLDGNNVAIEDEVTDQLSEGLQYQALVEAANHKLGLLKTAIVGG